MKIRHALTVIFLSISLLLTTVYYYGFDPKVLLSFSFYENLANPSIKIIKIQEGLRKEELAEILGSKLGWDKFEKSTFINAHLALNTGNLEGQYFPNTYMIHKDEKPIAVTSTMINEFTKQTAKVKKTKSSKITNPDTALKIASIIQRESGGKNDMKLISGIIWNRLFNGMKLQMDATLQYAKGSEEDGWWGRVDPKDKSINSPYNTYANKGLPPSPIANPGLAAIEAAYNPIATNCIYYLHDKRGKIHCSKTYDGHKRNIEIYY
ncbi:MAG: endolytic transglycosylase MltG [Minisyncoccia bacterium]